MRPSLGIKQSAGGDVIGTLREKSAGAGHGLIAARSPSPDELPALSARALAHGVAVVVDFDNTLTTADVGDLVADRFGGPAWRELDAQHHRGEVSLRALLSFMFGTMRTSHAELAGFARGVTTLRPGAAAFLAAARELELPVILASGGLDLYIRAILGELALGLPMVCNRAHFGDDGELVVSYPEWTLGCGHCGNCKAVVVETLRARGVPFVIGVGDGPSDRCLARAADLVVARDKLHTFTETLAPPRALVRFDDFHDVARAVATRVPAFAEVFARHC